MEEGMILGTALNILTTLQTLHLHYRMTVELNNLVVLLWKQELAHVKKTTKYGQSLFLTTHVFCYFNKVVWILCSISDIVY